MKVNMNFLPKEHHAFLLDRRTMYISIAVWVLSMMIWTFKIRMEWKEVLESTQKVRQAASLMQAEEAALKNKIYPKERIQSLIDRFQFIQEAMGQIPRPYLRFYQSLEDAIPTGSGGRGVYIVRLNPKGGTAYELEGEARTWEDALQFESNLKGSQYQKEEFKSQNFQNVKLNRSYRLQGTSGYRFYIDLEFVEGF